MNPIPQDRREMITYRQDGLQPFKITVKLSGKVVGYIKREKDGSGYYYVPRGVKVFTSATYPSVQAVKAHIESGQ